MKTQNENIRLIRPFLRGLPFIIIITILSVAAAVKYVHYATPLYESTAKIRLADTKEGAASSNLYKDFDVFASANAIGAETEVIRSKLIIGKALDSTGFDICSYRIGKVKKTELYLDCPFIITVSANSSSLFGKTFSLRILPFNKIEIAEKGSDKIITSSLGRPVIINRDTVLIEKNETLLAQKPYISVEDNYEFIIQDRERLIDDILNNLEVTSVDKDIPVLRITYKNTVPEKAADFVNRLSQTYIKDYIEFKSKSADTAVRFLDSQLQTVGSRLASSENAIESYRNDKRIINLRQETETDLRKIAEMKIQQTNVRMNLEAITDLYNYMESGADITELAPNFEAYTDLLATELIKKMKLLQAEKKDLLIKYTPEEEQVQAIDSKINDISKYLKEGIGNSRKNLQVKYERITRDIATAEEAFNGLPAKEKNMGILNRNFMLNEQAYNFLHEKRTEAQIAGASGISFHRIISPGEVPAKPVSPNSGLIEILAGFMGFAGSILLVYIIYAAKGKVSDAAEIERNSSVPVAALTPMLKNEQAATAHFRKTAVQLELKGLLKKNSILAISSFSDGEGKCFHAFNLCNELTRQRRRVLLADAHGVVSSSKNIKPYNELFTCVNLSGDEYKTLNSEEIKMMFDNWRQQYDMVIIKNENIHNTETGLMLMKLSDANIFLFDTCKTSKRMIQEAELLQDEYKFPNMQFMLNRSGFHPGMLRRFYRFVISGISSFKKTS